MENVVHSLPKLVVVVGSTASGKSALGIRLAQRFHGEIVSADSRQVYRGLDIGTAKVSAQEQALAPHHLLDVVDPWQVYTVAQFQREAIAAIDDILARGSQPLLVGGSPHYIQAVIDHLDVPQIPPQPELRAQLLALPHAELLARLAELDPHCYATIDQQNARRVIRALEVCIISGKPFSQQRSTSAPLYEPLLVGIHWPREVLYARIDQRVDARMQQGMVHEVQTLLEQGLSFERLESLGLEYRFVGRWLHGDFPDEATMVQRLKYAIHDFVRRQLTWFRREQRIVWVQGGEDGEEEAERIVRAFLLPRNETNQKLNAEV